MLFAVPTRPNDLNITNNQENRLTIVWAPPDTGTVYHHYRVYVHPGGPDGGVLKGKHLTSDTLSGLTANTAYTINITAVSDHSGLRQESNPTTATGWTSKIYVITGFRIGNES